MCPFSSRRRRQRAGQDAKIGTCVKQRVFAKRPNFSRRGQVISPPHEPVMCWLIGGRQMRAPRAQPPSNRQQRSTSAWHRRSQWHTTRSEFSKNSCGRPACPPRRVNFGMGGLDANRSTAMVTHSCISDGRQVSSSPFRPLGDRGQGAGGRGLSPQSSRHGESATRRTGRSVVTIQMCSILQLICWLVVTIRAECARARGTTVRRATQAVGLKDELCRLMLCRYPHDCLHRQP